MKIELKNKEEIERIIANTTINENGGFRAINSKYDFIKYVEMKDYKIYFLTNEAHFTPTKNIKTRIWQPNIEEYADLEKFIKHNLLDYTTYYNNETKGAE